MAAVAPDGTAWARELKAFGREVETITAGQVKVKWYLGGIAGDEMEALERVHRGQLDGLAGAIFCQRLAPSLKVMRIPGTFQQRDEHRYVLARLRPQLVEEFQRAGFEVIGLAPFGTDIVFTRAPVHSFGELKLLRLWVWDIDTVVRKAVDAMGLSTLATPLEEVRSDLDSGKLEGVIGLPSAALGFQWSPRLKYFLDLKVNILPGCMVVASRAFDRLPGVLRDDLRDAGARMAARFDEAGRALEDQLLNGLFEKQGLIKLTASDTLRAAYFQAARAARDKIGADLVPRALLDQVLGWLADYRAEHPR